MSLTYVIPDIHGRDDLLRDAHRRLTQRATLGDGFLVLSNNLGAFLTAFWGIWLIPFGLVTIKSGFFPRILGFLLLAAGLGYITSCITYILFPGAAPAVSKIVFPLYFGELPIVLWMLVMGAKPKLPSS